jgi:hypothetical protein
MNLLYNTYLNKQKSQYLSVRYWDYEIWLIKELQLTKHDCFFNFTYSPGNLDFPRAGFNTLEDRPAAPDTTLLINRL